MPTARVLCIGDIVGKPGRKAIAEQIPRIKREKEIDVVIANAENVSGGAGLTPKHSQLLLDAGVDVLTCGDHVWDKREMIEHIQGSNNILRPLNFPKGNPGRGYCIIDKDFGKVCIIHLVGRVFMKYLVDSPFIMVDELLANMDEKPPVIIVDMHAEATSEKVAMGWFLDGRVSVVFGTHTHIPTADETILPKGTAYITDVGMTGPYRSVIGRSVDKILKRFVTQMPAFMDVATDDVRMYGFLVDVDTETGRAITATTVLEKLS